MVAAPDGSGARHDGVERLHAQHHIGLIKRVLGNQRTRRLVRRIRQEGAAARARLDGDVVTGSTELAHQVGDHSDTRLPESLLSGYRDAHITKPNALISHLLAHRALNSAATVITRRERTSPLTLPPCDSARFRRSQQSADLDPH